MGKHRVLGNVHARLRRSPARHGERHASRQNPVSPQLRHCRRFVAFSWCRPKHLYRLDLINVSRPQLKSQSLTVRRDRSSIRGTWISIVPTGNRQGVGILTWLPATVFYPVAAFKHCFLGQRSRCLPPVRTPSQARSRTKPSPMMRSGPTPLRLAPPDRTSGPLWSLPVAAILLPRRLIWSWGSGFLLPVSAKKEPQEQRGDAPEVPAERLPRGSWLGCSARPSVVLVGVATRPQQLIRDRLHFSFNPAQNSCRHAIAASCNGVRDRGGGTLEERCDSP